MCKLKNCSVQLGLIHFFDFRATIFLHEPHAEVRSAECISALKIRSSARAILELVYALQSTSYDITLLDTFGIVGPVYSEPVVRH